MKAGRPAVLLKHSESICARSSLDNNRPSAMNGGDHYFETSNFSS